jgi:hypothetical protein
MLGCSLAPFVHSPTPIFHSGLSLGVTQLGSLFPYPFATACCATEYMSLSMSPYDIDRLSKMVHPEHFLNSALQKISREFTGSHEIPYESLLARCSLG